MSTSADDWRTRRRKDKREGGWNNGRMGGLSEKGLTLASGGGTFGQVVLHCGQKERVRDRLIILSIHTHISTHTLS